MPHNVETKLDCIASPHSRVIFTTNTVPTDELPTTVESVRSGWLSTFQSAATVVRKTKLFGGFRD